MLKDHTTKAFVPTMRPKKSKSFYKTTLGLKLLAEDDYGMEFDANGTLLRVIFVESFMAQPFTILGWNVPDISGIIKALNKKGVVCERYEFMKQDKLGIWKSPGGSKVAWFKDPDGNVLSLTE
jgi:predicted enzyme related to lactoylglutathione lyase